MTDHDHFLSIINSNPACAERWSALVERAVTRMTC
jgi:hypothetical protein